MGNMTGLPSLSDYVPSLTGDMSSGSSKTLSGPWDENGFIYCYNHPHEEQFNDHKENTNHKKDDHHQNHSLCSDLTVSTVSTNTSCRRATARTGKSTKGGKANEETEGGNAMEHFSCIGRLPAGTPSRPFSQSLLIEEEEEEEEDNDGDDDMSENNVQLPQSLFQKYNQNRKKAMHEHIRQLQSDLDNVKILLEKQVELEQRVRALEHIKIPSLSPSKSSKPPLLIPLSPKLPPPPTTTKLQLPPPKHPLKQESQQEQEQELQTYELPPKPSSTRTLFKRTKKVRNQEGKNSAYSSLSSVLSSKK